MAYASIAVGQSHTEVTGRNERISINRDLFSLSASRNSLNEGITNQN